MHVYWLKRMRFDSVTRNCKGEVTIMITMTTVVTDNPKDQKESYTHYSSDYVWISPLLEI